jgi:hypothetical protein
MRNSPLDNLLTPRVRLLSRVIPAFQLCGYAGLALAIALTQALILARGLSPWVMAAITLADVATFFALGMVTKIIVGKEILIYYHHVIAVLMAAALLLWLLGQPLLPYLDIATLGVGAFVACGRVGCLMVGCCYGRPHRWGVRYGQAHVAAGLDPHLVGARLFPTQLVESFAVAGIVLVGSALVLTRQPDGAALTWYIVAYGLGRFGLEFMRGDTGRPYYWGFSEAQWISLGLLLALVGAEWMGLLPWRWWHIAAAVVLAGALLVIALRRHADGRHRLLMPAHIAELAAALDRTPAYDNSPALTSIMVAATSENLQISTGVLIRDQRPCYHYTISRRGMPLSYAAAQAAAELILHIRHPAEQHELVKGGNGVFHVIVSKESANAA